MTDGDKEERIALATALTKPPHNAPRIEHVTEDMIEGTLDQVLEKMVSQEFRSVEDIPGKIAAKLAAQWCRDVVLAYAKKHDLI